MLSLVWFGIFGLVWLVWFGRFGMVGLVWLVGIEFKATQPSQGLAWLSLAISKELFGQSNFDQKKFN